MNDLTKQLAAENDDLKREVAELKSCVSGLSGLVNQWMADHAKLHERREALSCEVAALRTALDQSLERERALWVPGWAKAALRVWRAKREPGANE